MENLTFEVMMRGLSACYQDVISQESGAESRSEAYKRLIEKGLLLSNSRMIQITSSPKFVERYLRYDESIVGTHFNEVYHSAVENLEHRRDEIKQQLSDTDWVEIGRLLLRDNRRFPKSWKKDARYPASALCLYMTRLELHVAAQDKGAVFSDILDMIRLSLDISKDPERQFDMAVLDKVDSAEDAAYLLFWYEQGLKQTQELIPLFDKIIEIYQEYKDQILPLLQKTYRQANIRPALDLFFLTELYVHRAEHWLNSEDVFAVQQGIEQYRLIEKLYCRKSPNYILYCHYRRLYGYQRCKRMMDFGKTKVYSNEKLLKNIKEDLSLPLMGGTLTPDELIRYAEFLKETQNWLAEQNQ